jgi:2-amino-4-hydroxy-6-hydroxymethyldihydropteridine diphosphokinase
MTNHYYISLGSNMGDSREILIRAVERLSAWDGVTLLRRSSFYETDPWGKTDQAVFLNAAIYIAWEGNGEELLSVLHTIEQEGGRKRLVHWGPRTLDLDILYSEEETVHSETLNIPHPYFWDRLFVLIPLEEIEPDFTYQGETIAHRIESLGQKGSVRKLNLSWTKQ